jgi:phosphorylase kinase alpha/beta subunit
VALLPAWRQLAARPLSVARAVALRQETDPNQWLRQLVASANPYEQIELLTLLWERLGAEFITPQGVSLRQLTEAVYLQAGTARLWSVLRRAAGLLDRADGELATAVATLLARGYRVSVGRGYSDQAIIARPLATAEIMQRLRAYGGDDPRCRALLQEIVLLLGRWQRAEPAGATGKPLLRPWQLLLRMTGSLARDWGITRGEACEVLLRLSPSTLLNRLRQVLSAGGADDDDQVRVRLDGLRYQGELPGLLHLHVPATGGLTLIGDELWGTWRQVHGTLLHLPEDFAEQLRVLLAHCRGLVIGDQLDPRNRLDSYPLLAEPPRTVALEQRVALLLQAIRGPAYRQLTLEALLALTDLFRSYPDLQVDDYLVLDVLIGTAVRLTWEQTQPTGSADGYADCCADAWNAFYANPPHRVARAILAALGLLLEAPAQAAGEG